MINRTFSYKSKPLLSVWIFSSSSHQTAQPIEALPYKIFIIKIRPVYSVELHAWFRNLEIISHITRNWCTREEIWAIAGWYETGLLTIIRPHKWFWYYPARDTLYIFISHLRVLEVTHWHLHLLRIELKWDGKITKIGLWYDNEMMYTNNGAKCL